jgi:hypothetical protein
LRNDWHIDEIVAGYIADLAECSGGLAKFQVVERIVADNFLTKEPPGVNYTAASYLQILNDNTADKDERHFADYMALVNQFNLLQRVANNDFDEVWMFGYEYGGFYESRMIGAGAFWCNAPELVTAGRRFIMMGFNPTRGVGEMLESFSHRAESIIRHVYELKPGIENLFERYTRYDKQNPGQAEVGTVHFAPNSEQDYDWGNPRLVPSRCDDWFNFPKLQGMFKQVNCLTWNTPPSPNPDSRPHHKWWLTHLPKVAGSTNGVANNWWKYIIQPDNLFFDH